MKRFLQTKAGVLSLVGFTLLMAFMLHRVLAGRNDSKEVGVSSDSNLVPVKKASPSGAQQSKPGANAPTSRTTTEVAATGSGKSGTAESGSPQTVLQKELPYLDLVRDSSSHSRTDKGRDGVTVTRRRTAPPAQARHPTDPAADAAMVSINSLRLTGRLRDPAGPKAIRTAAEPDSVVPSASEPPPA